jgi:hypothetical protein
MIITTIVLGSIILIIILSWNDLWRPRNSSYFYVAKTPPPPLPSSIKVYSVKGYLVVNKSGTVLFFFNDKPIRSANHWVPQSMEENFIEIFETNVKINWEDEPREAILEITTRR